MAIFNKTKRQAKRDASPKHLNWMGGSSYDISDPVKRLRMAASSCFFGEPMYYHRDKGDARPTRLMTPSRLSKAQVAHLRAELCALEPAAWRGLSPSELMESAIDDALRHDAEATLREAVRLRKESMVRTTPQVILVRAANHVSVRGSGLVRKYAKEIMKRADEPAVAMAYQLHAFGKPIPNALKKACKDVLESFDDYALSKYRLESRAVKTVDVINLVHAKSDAIDKLAKGELSSKGKTWESIVSTSGSTKQVWEATLPKMGHMALLRNLRNLAKHEVPSKLYRQKLIKGAAGGKQLPFRYYSAYRAVKDGDKKVLQAIEQCLESSMGNLPRFSGRTMCLADNSGSAQGSTTSAMGSMRMSTIANLTGLLAGRRSDEGHLGVFGDKLLEQRVTGESIFKQLDAAEKLAKRVGQATENGIWLFWDKAIRNAEKWDNVFVFSDMQAGHGGLYGTNPTSYAAYRWDGGRMIDVPKLINTYRKKVNPKVNVFLVQVAGYQDTIVPEFYDRTYILGGWGPGLLGFASEMCQQRRKR